MRHAWGWEFWPTTRYIAGRIRCLCNWATHVLRIRTPHDMTALETHANQHTPNRGWDTWHPSKLEVPA